MKALFDFDMNWYRDGFITIIELFAFLIINITSLITTTKSSIARR